MRGRRRFHAATCAALVALVAPCGARADATSGVVGGVSVDKKVPQAGDPIVVQIVLSPSTGAWSVGSYAARVSLRTLDGAVVAESPDVAGDASTAAGQIATIFVPLTVPQSAAGQLIVRATVTHDGNVVGDDAQTGFVVGALVAPPPDATRRSTLPGGIAGDINTTTNFAAQQSQSAAFSFNGKYAGDRSFTSTFGLSDVPGQSKPLLGFQTQQTLTQVGTFTAAYDPGVLSGATGSGFSVKRQVGPNPNASVQLAYLSGAHATANPFEIAAVSAAAPFLGGEMTVTAGNVYVTGAPTQGAAFFMRNGTFAGLQFVRAPNAANVGYGLRYGIIDYDDELAHVRRADRVVEATTTFTLARIGWSVDVVRAGPYFPTLSAPGVTPDRESETVSATVPLGRFAVNASINSYRDALNGSPLTQTTHFVTESLGTDYTLPNSDVVSLKLSNAIQHQIGAQIVANGNDDTGITYTLRRGVYGLAFALGSANQRSTTGTLAHTMQDSVTASRTVAAGFTASTAFNFTNVAANAAAGVNVVDALNVGLGYTRGPMTLSSSISRALTRPGAGLAQPPSTAINYGIAMKPSSKAPLNLSATMTQTRGATGSTTGGLNLSRNF